MCLIWNLIKAFVDTEDDNKKDNKDLEDWQKELELSCSLKRAFNRALIFMPIL